MQQADPARTCRRHRHAFRGEMPRTTRRASAAPRLRFAVPPPADRARPHAMHGYALLTPLPVALQTPPRRKRHAPTAGRACRWKKYEERQNGTRRHAVGRAARSRGRACGSTRGSSRRANSEYVPRATMPAMLNQPAQQNAAGGWQTRGNVFTTPTSPPKRARSHAGTAARPPCETLCGTRAQFLRTPGCARVPSCRHPNFHARQRQPATASRRMRGVRQARARREDSGQRFAAQPGAFCAVVPLVRGEYDHVTTR